MQKCGKILRGRKDTLAPVVSTLRGGDRPRRPRRSDASELGHLSAVRRKHIILSVQPNAAPSAAVDWPTLQLHQHELLVRDCLQFHVPKYRCSFHHRSR